MKRLVKFSLEDGSTVLVEVDEPDTGGVVRAGRGEVIENAKESFDIAMSKISPAIEHVTSKLRKLAKQPSEIEMVFGIKLNAEAGAFLASASTEANFQVTLKWTSTT